MFRQKIVQHVKKISVPENILRPDYSAAALEAGYQHVSLIEHKSDIVKLRQANRIVASALKYANSLLKNASITPISTNDINDHLHNFIIKNQAYPSPLYYQNFPKSISISVNEIAIHGIASDYILQPGDVVKIDVSVFFQGFHGDTCQTFIVPYSEKEFENLSFLEKQNFVKNLQLINTTKKLVEVGINSVRLNQKITEIGKKMEHFIKTINFNQPACNQFSINQNYQGHGVGKYFHSLPMVPFWSENSGFIDHFTKNFVIRPGLCFTIEPVVFNCGMEKNQIVYEDGSFFNGRSLNNIRCAQVEHSLLVHSDGKVEVLSR